MKKLMKEASQETLVVKNTPANAGDSGLIPGTGRSSGGGHDNPLQYSCRKNPMDRGAWPTTVHRVTQSRTRLKQLSMQHCPKLQVKNPQVHRNYFCFSCANTIKFSRLQYSSYVVFQSRLAFLYTPTKNSIISVS